MFSPLEDMDQSRYIVFPYLDDTDFSNMKVASPSLRQLPLCRWDWVMCLEGQENGSAAFLHSYHFQLSVVSSGYRARSMPTECS